MASTFALARWFTPGTSLSDQQGELLREIHMMLAYQFTHWGLTDDGKLMLKVPASEEEPESGVMAIEKDKFHKGIVWVEWVSDVRWVHYRWWMNASSLEDLRERILHAQDKRVSYDALFTGEPLPETGETK